MQKFNGSLIRQFPSLTTGNAAAGVQVSVYISGTNTLATLYAANNTAGAQLSNPLPTDGKGFYAFFAVDGRYRLEYNNGFPALEIQLVDVIDINTEFNAAISGLQDTVDTLTITAPFDFNTGGTVTARNQVVLWSTANGGDGREYRWAGALPKTVPPASTPLTTGGISDSAWVYTANVAFEQELAENSSANIVGGITAGNIAFPVSDIAALIAAPLIDGRVYAVKSYHSGWAAVNTPAAGGGTFVYRSTYPKTEHDGGLVIDPARPFPTNWSDNTQKDNWFTAAVSGTGCFVREYYGNPSADYFGTFADKTNSDLKQLQVALDSSKLIQLSERGLHLLDGSLEVRRGAKGLVGNTSLYQDLPDILQAKGSGLFMNVQGTALEFVVGTQNTIPAITLRDFGIWVDKPNSRGVDFRSSIYGNFENIGIRLNGSNSSGWYGIGNGVGSAPYYNKIDGTFVFGNADKIAFPGQIGFHFQGDGLFLADGPNANVISNVKHLAGLQYGFLIESGVGNIINNVVFETIADNVFYIGSAATPSEGRAIENTITGVWGEGASTCVLARFDGLASENVISNYAINSVSDRLFQDDTPGKNNVVSAKSKAQSFVFSNIINLTAGAANPIHPTARDWVAAGFGGVIPAIKGYPKKMTVIASNISGSMVGTATVRLYRSGAVHPELQFVITDAARSGVVFNSGQNMTAAYNSFDGTNNSSLEVVVTTTGDFNQAACHIRVDVEMVG